jgi:hypothetical protein
VKLIMNLKMMNEVLELNSNMKLNTINKQSCDVEFNLNPKLFKQTILQVKSRRRTGSAVSGTSCRVRASTRIGNPKTKRCETIAGGAKAGE